MKNLFFFLFTLSILSCSNDKDESIDPNDPYGGTFKMTMDGNEIPFHNTLALERNNYVRARLTDSKVFRISVVLDQFDKEFEIDFDSRGRMIESRFQRHLEGSYEQVFYKNYPHYSSNFFNFNLISIDTVQKKIKGTFSGKLYKSGSSGSLDFSDNIQFDNGEFELNYTLAPDLWIFDSYSSCSAKIDGNDWIATQRLNGGSYFLSEFVNGDQYKFGFTFGHSAQEGSYNFNPSDTDKKISFSKFDPVTFQYNYYQTTGNLTITEKRVEQVFNNGTFYFFKGTYNFTAVNPDDAFDAKQITTGSFDYLIHTN